MSDTTVFLVDDHDLARAGVRSFLEGRFDIVGEADNADSAIELIGERRPQVVLLDVHLPGGGGARVAREISEAFPDEVALLALSMSDDAGDVADVVASGASGYLLKTVSREELIAAVERVADGEAAVFSPTLAGIVLERLTDVDPRDVDEEFASITPKELKVLRFIARGYTYREVGERLFMSVKTVETHVSHLLRKLHLKNRTELARYALEHNVD